MAIICYTLIPSGRFHYDKTENTFSAEASNLDKEYNLFSRIYDDACDQGFMILSDRTNKTVAFYHDSTDTKDGDIRFWIFKPIPEYVRKYPHLKNCKVYIWND